MGPKAQAIESSGNAAEESSWMDRVCHKIETYLDLGEPGRESSLIVQEIEVHFNTFGAGLRRFANEANDFVQDLLKVPIIPSEGFGENSLDLPKQFEMHGEQKVAKQSAKRGAAAAPITVFDEAWIKMSKKGLPMEGLDAAYRNGILFKVQSVDKCDEFPFAEVAWDWPRQPYHEAVKAHKLPQQASNQTFESQAQPHQGCKDETVSGVAEDVKTAREMVEGEDHSTATRSLTDDFEESRRGGTFDSALLEGWDGDDIVDEELEEDDELEDWEIV